VLKHRFGKRIRTRTDFAGLLGHWIGGPDASLQAHNDAANQRYNDVHYAGYQSPPQLLLAVRHPSRLIGCLDTRLRRSDKCGSILEADGACQDREAPPEGREVLTRVTASAQSFFGASGWDDCCLNLDLKLGARMAPALDESIPALGGQYPCHRVECRGQRIILTGAWAAASAHRRHAACLVSRSAEHHNPDADQITMSEFRCAVPSRGF